MKQEVIEFNKDLRGKEFIDFYAGDIVKVHLKIKEGAKERVQIFEGLVIAIKGRQSSSPTLTVRKVSHGVGVEMIVPILSKNVEKVELIKRAKVRRSKLYYVRDLTPKQSRMKYKDIKDFTKIEETTEATEVAEEVEEKLSEEEIKTAEKEMEKEAVKEEAKEAKEAKETKEAKKTSKAEEAKEVE